MKPLCGRCNAELSAPGAAAKPIHLTDGNFGFELQRAGSTPLLVDFWAPWCGPCQMLGPTIEALAEAANGQYLVGKLDTQQNPRTARQHQISSIPAMLIFKNGSVVDQLIGVQPRPVIEKRLLAHAERPPRAASDGEAEPG